MTGIETVPFLQSGTAKKCVGMATFVISHSDELANLSDSSGPCGMKGCL